MTAGWLAELEKPETFLPVYKLRGLREAPALIPVCIAAGIASPSSKVFGASCIRALPGELSIGDVVAGSATGRVAAIIGVKHRDLDHLQFWVLLDIFKESTDNTWSSNGSQQLVQADSITRKPLYMPLQRGIFLHLPSFN